MSFPSPTRFNCFAAAVRLLPLLCCAVCPPPLHAPTTAFNPDAALTGTPAPIEQQPGLRLPPLQTPQFPQACHRGLLPLLGIILYPHLHKYTGIFSQMFSVFFFLLSFLGLFHSAAPPHPVFLLEVSALTNRRLASVYSASAPGVMGAVEPHPLGRTVASSRRLSPAPSAPHHSLMQKTGLFSPGVKVPLGNDFTDPKF